MRGHIVKRYENSYSIILNMGRDPATGQRKQQWVSVKGTKKEAEKRLADLLHQLDTGTFMQPSKTTFAEYLTKWLADYAKPNVAPRSFERYTGVIQQHLIPDLGSLPLTQLRPEHLQSHYTAKLNAGLSASSIRYHHAVIHIALQTAVKWGLLGRNVADAVEPPRIHRAEMQTWDEGEVNQFLEAAKDSPYYALFHTAIYTGMRRSELLGLRWSDIEFLLPQLSVNRSLHHLKNGSYVFTEPKSDRSRRTIALSPSAVLTLQNHHETQKLERLMLGVELKENDLVFSRVDGKPLRPNSITRAWDMMCKRAGVKKIRLHDARHTHASLMLKQGIHPKIVQERLGHSSIQITLDTYSHVAPGLQQAAANRFDEIINPTRENEAVGKVG